MQTYPALRAMDADLRVQVMRALDKVGWKWYPAVIRLARAHPHPKLWHWGNWWLARARFPNLPYLRRAITEIKGGLEAVSQFFRSLSSPLRKRGAYPSGPVMGSAFPREGADPERARLGKYGGVIRV